jgi:hypothetical protein
MMWFLVILFSISHGAATSLVPMQTEEACVTAANSVTDQYTVLTAECFNATIGKTVVVK